MSEWNEALERAAKVADVYAAEIVPELRDYEAVDPATLPILFESIAENIRRLKRH